MDITEVARKGGKSRSEKKRAASRRNLALARASIKIALDMYKHGRTSEEQKDSARIVKTAGDYLEQSALQNAEQFRPNIFTPVLLTRKDQ